MIAAFVLIGGGIVYLAACLVAFTGHVRSHKRLENITPSVSVIIAARNEEKTIGKLLGDLLRQDYPADKLELIAVDDCSEDGTKAVIEEFSARDKRVRLVETRLSRSPYTHKKRVVHDGILSSTGEIIMTTDADCRVHHTWIRTMVSYFTPGVELVAGTVVEEAHGLLGIMESLELIGIQAMAAGFMNRRFPLTCNGASLAYRRSAFARVNGFENIGQLVSGDDDLLMQKIARGDPSRVVFAFGRETAVISRPSATLGEFLARRSRWASKISRYPSSGAAALMVVFFTFFTVISAWFVLAVAGLAGFGIFAVGYGLKTAGDLLLTAYGAVRMKRAKYLLVFPLAEVLHVPYILGVTLRGYFGSFEWRGRRTAAFSTETGERTHD